MVETEVAEIGALAVVRFVSELAMLAALAYVGWRLGDGGPAGLALAVVLPVAAAAAWGSFVGPRAARRLRDPARLGVELLLFGLAVAGLLAYGAWIAAIVLAALYLSSTLHGRRGG